MSWLQAFLNKYKPVPVTQHIEVQREQGPPFYCGTAFCGHHTIKAAEKCWQDKCAALERIKIEAAALHNAGKHAEACQMEDSETARYYPERDRNNWPINRSSAEMQLEYLKKAKAGL